MRIKNISILATLATLASAIIIQDCLPPNLRQVRMALRACHDEADTAAKAVPRKPKHMDEFFKSHDRAAMLEVQQTLQIAAWRCNDPVQEPVNHLFDGGEHLPVPDDTFAITCRPNVAACGQHQAFYTNMTSRVIHVCDRAYSLRTRTVGCHEEDQGSALMAEVLRLQLPHGTSSPARGYWNMKRLSGLASRKNIFSYSMFAQAIWSDQKPRNAINKDDPPCLGPQPRDGPQPQPRIANRGLADLGRRSVIINRERRAEEARHGNIARDLHA